MKIFNLSIASIYCVLLSIATSINAFSSTLTPNYPRKKVVKQSCSIYQVGLQASARNNEDIYGAVHRKEYEMRKVKQQHTSTTDPVRMAMGYAQENPTEMRMARALRRVYEDPLNPANPNYVSKTEQENQRDKKLREVGMADLGMRRGSFIVDIKRKSLTHPGKVFCNFDDAGMVAEAMVRLGADAVIINTDFPAYGGDMSELKSAVRAVRKISDTAAVIMKDIIVDEIQLGLAKEAGVDGVVLMASVLGPSLESFLDLATTIGLEVIVECHTRNEVERSLELMAQNIMINNYDRVSQQLFPEQAIQLAGVFPGSGGPVICLATGGIETTDQMKRHLAVGYDGVVVGKAVMGCPKAPEFIRAVRDRTLLPAEFSGWGLDDVEFDMDGNVMQGPKRDIIDQDDESAYQ